MADKDFVVEAGTLVRYLGKDENITVPDGVCYINQHFDCPKIKSIHIPASVIHI